MNESLRDGPERNKKRTEIKRKSTQEKTIEKKCVQIPSVEHES